MRKTSRGRGERRRVGKAESGGKEREQEDETIKTKEEEEEEKDEKDRQGRRGEEEEEDMEQEERKRRFECRCLTFLNKKRLIFMSCDLFFSIFFLSIFECPKQQL